MSFPQGGIHPPESKFTAADAIVTLPLAPELHIALHQHIGKPANPLVKVGDEVKKGQLIGESDGLISARIHSSVNGKVKKIDKLKNALGIPQPTIIIIPEADQPPHELPPEPESEMDLAQFSAEQIVKAIQDKGIVGSGGATFPTNVKYMVPDGKSADTLIINGVECEPYLTVDHRLMLECPEQILSGTELLRKALGVERAIIGIEANKPDAITELTNRAKSHPHVSVQALEVKYPQGAEKQLIKAITGRETPSGKLPLDVGCVVNNVGTAMMVYQAVVHEEPFIDRVVTVSGNAVAKPGNYLVPLGTPISYLLEQAGVELIHGMKLILGGPMMGKAVSHIDGPVIKGTSGILVFNPDEASRPAEKPCIRCSRCVHACPMGLEPYFLSALVRTGNYVDAYPQSIMDCVECGSCVYICPADKPLLDYIREGKFKIIQDRRKGKLK
jgi:electron transport complex protein RnfC